MNSKKNSFKRVAAGALAVLTVAAYTAPVANVGGLPTVKSLVAEAAHSAIVSSSSTSLYGTTLEVDDYFASDATLTKNTKEKARIDFGFNDGDFVIGKIDKITDYSNPIVPDAGIGNTIENVTAVRYYDKLKDGSNGKRLVVTAKADNKDVYYVVALNGDDGVATSKELEKLYIGVDDNRYDEGNKVYTIDFEKNEVDQSGYNVGIDNFAKGYIDSISYTTVQGDANTITTNTVLSMGGPTAKERTTVTIVASALLDIKCADQSEHAKTSYSNGKFTYKFDAVGAFDVKVKENGFYFSDGNDPGFKIKRTTDKKAVVLGDGKIYSGSTITLTSKTPFTIAKGAIKSQKTDGTYTYDDVTGVYANGGFSATFVVSDQDITITNGTLADVALSYNTSGQKITASGMDKENVQVIKDAPVGSFTVTSKVPQYSDSAKRIVKKDNKGNILYTETAVANGKSIKYNPDRYSFVEADFTVDPNLIADATADTRYKIVVSNGTVTDTYEFSGDELTGIADEANAVSHKDKDGRDVNDADAISAVINNLDPEEDGTPSFAIGMKYAGTYTIDLYVYGAKAEDGAKKVSLKYTISKITSISANDLTLRAFYSDDVLGYTGARKDYFDALANPALDDEDVAEFKAALDNYIEEKSLVITKNSSVFEVGALAEDITAKGNGVQLFAELADGTACEIDGTEVLGKIGAKSTNTKAVVTDPNYSVSPIAITWKLVTATVEDAIMFDVPEEQLVEGYVPASYETLEATVKQYLKSTNKVDVKKATFKYAKTLSNDGLVDIDTLTDGLPTGDTADDADVAKYYIYAYVDDLETAEPLPIAITVINTKVQAVLNRTTFTYGEQIEASDFKFVKAGTNTAIDGLAFKDYDTDGDGDDDFDVDDCLTITIKDKKGNEINNEAGINGLVPNKSGEKYTVTVTYNANGDQYINQNGYTFEDEDVAGGVVAEKTFTITVSKKKLDGSMIDFGVDDEDNPLDIFTKEIPKNSVAKVTAGDFNVIDKDVDDANPIGVTVSGGTSSTSTPGTYTVKLGVSNEVAEGTIKWSDLYTGSIDVTWAAKKADVEVFDEFSFDYEVEDTTDGIDYIHDNIYSENGKVFIHAEAKLAEEDGTELTTAHKDKIKIKSIGFVYEKGGLLKDLTNDDVAEATETLKLGVCSATNVGTQKNSDLIAGINSTVTSIDDYIWIRPYVVTTEGVVKYGTARRLDFTTVAQKVIKPELIEPQLVGKTVNGTAGLYNYVYASKNTKDDVIYRTADPKAFGVVISRTGNYTAIPEGAESVNAGANEAIYNAYIASLNGAYFDERTLVDTPAKKQYLAELKKAYGLTLDTAEVSSKATNNSNYTADECGTLIKITDSLSRVYVRTYVDFGSGLVVYSEPKSIESANSLLAEELFGLKTYDEVRDAEHGGNNTYAIAAVRDASDTYDAAPSVNTLKNVAQVFEPIKYISNGSTAAAKQNQVSEFGILLDTKGIVCDDKYDKNHFVLGAGFDVRKSTKPNVSNTATDFDSTFDNDDDHKVFGGITSNANKASARAYLVYRGVTFYGNVVSNQD